MPRPKKRDDGPAPGGVRVVVRCRPFLAHERGMTSDRLFLDGNTITVNDTVGEARKFTFDSVLPPEADQADSFAEVAQLVDHVLDGLHATVFAYGQTGSGKTYTMEGFQYRAITTTRPDGTTAKSSAPDPISTPNDQHGIMLRAVQLLFDRARERQGTTAQGEPPIDGPECPDSASHPSSSLPHRDRDRGTDGDGVQYAFRCSYYQIYNERITDLLRPASSSAHRNSLANTVDGASRPRQSLGDRGVDDELRVRWYRGDVFKVENLFLYECDTAEKMREALVSGVRQKVMGSHLMNAQSSRSHCVFTIYVERRQAATQQLLSRSELSLVDLAGSEKLKQLSSDPSAALVRESIDINASLLALGKVIMALSSRPAGKRGGGGADGHVPYRDSKLTKLLKHALGGNSVTVMFACITPSDRYVEESVSTLLYAGRAKNIENVPRVNEDPTIVLIRQLRDEIQQLKKELAYYRALATDTISQQELAVRQGLGDGGPLDNGASGEAASTTQSADDITADGTVSSAKAAQLADSLLAACDLLQKVMSVNGQLRDAFEVAKQDKQAAELREVQLNAENIALRERIEMLESIALNPALYTADGQGNGSPALDALTPSPGHSTAPHNPDSASDDDDEAGYGSARAASDRYPVTPSPPMLRRQQHTAETGRRPPRTRQEQSTVAPWDTSPLPPPPVPAPTAQAWTVPVDAAATSSAPPRRRPIRAPSPDVEDGDGVGNQPHATTTEPRDKRAEKKKKKKKTKKALVRRLKQYEQRYREPSHVETYADYYGKARATLPENPQHTAALRDMDETLKKLPRDMVLRVVPLSLRQPGSFGALTFGGTREETEEYEERRQQRADRRDELLRKQKALQDTLRQDVAHVQDVAREEDASVKASAAQSVYGDTYVAAAATSSSTKRSGTMPQLPPNAAAASSLSSVDRLRAYLDKDKQLHAQSQPQLSSSLSRLSAPQISGSTATQPVSKETTAHMYNSAEDPRPPRNAW